MSIDFQALGAKFPQLQVDSRYADSDGIAYRLALPPFQAGHGFAAAELLLPKGFPERARARIRLSQDAVLKIPHVGDDRLLCTEGDPGPGRGFTPQERVELLLDAYYNDFLTPWLDGKLEYAFSKEPQNYWQIKVKRARGPHDPVREVWTVDTSPAKSIVREGLLLLPARTVVAADEGNEFTRRVVRSLGMQSSQRVRVLIADIPIDHAFEPRTWPRNTEGISRLLQRRLSDVQRNTFFGHIRRRQSQVHRIALFRNAQGGFAYLLPEGAAVVLREEGRKARTRPTHLGPLPLMVTRIDPAWTVGRDQHEEVYGRQSKHVLVLGAGALGSSVVEHLAKAGVGAITLVDPEDLEPANIGRHLIGMDAISERKAAAVARQVNRSHPSCQVTPSIKLAEQWLLENTLKHMDAVIDLTGEPDVRWAVDQARRLHPCPLLVGWMEPFVAAAHACALPANEPWIRNPEQPVDAMSDLEAVVWPAAVMRQTPGCSSRFQAYTAAQAGYAVALVSENALNLIDGDVEVSSVTSWVRGQAFLDAHWPGLQLRAWAKEAAATNGVMLKRKFA